MSVAGSTATNAYGKTPIYGTHAYYNNKETVHHTKVKKNIDNMLNNNSDNMSDADRIGDMIANFNFNNNENDNISVDGTESVASLQFDPVQPKIDMFNNNNFDTQSVASTEVSLPQPMNPHLVRDQQDEAFNQYQMNRSNVPQQQMQQGGNDLNQNMINEYKLDDEEEKQRRIDNINDMVRLLKAEDIPTKVDIPNESHSMEQIKEVERYYSKKVKRNRYSDIGEDVILWVAGIVSNQFDGSTTIGGYTLNLKGWPQTLRARLRRNRVSIADSMISTQERYGIPDITYTIFEIGVNALVYSERQQAEIKNAKRRNKTRKAITSIHDKDERNRM